ncbi:MAG: class I SAM-dependent methyltransferase [Microcoleaceae cyanobacterium]
MSHSQPKNDKNYYTYKTHNIVDYYKQLSQLQAAEQTFITLLKDRLSTFKMLDIGVGGGRTTQYFAPKVKEYIGIDYSAEMIAACQQRFTNYSESIIFEVGDARNMHQFLDNSFDLILFSFNGIDYVSHHERLQIFQEIKRVGKPGCYVFFSSHNLQSIAKQFNYKTHISLNPFTTYINLVMFGFLKLFNPSVTFQRLQTNDYLILRDESHNFRLRTYYIRPQEQIKQLQADFDQIEIYSWKTGQKIVDENDPALNSDLWLYYLCRLTDVGGSLLIN